MPPHPAIPLSRAWFTWSERPAEMVFLPLGVRLTPVAYAASTGRATVFPAGEHVVLGRHATDAGLVELALSHAGTRLDWSARKAGSFALAGGWSTRAAGEWGLRFWINLCLWTDGGETVRYDAAAQAAVVRVGARWVALVCREPAVQVTGHESLASLAEDYERHGYFNLASRATQARLLALRCNLEMTRDGGFAVAVADREDLAVTQARALLGAMPPAPELPMQSGHFAGALDAVRDVVAWNTVWDAANARPYTSISRNWNEAKFGGFGVWLNDQLYAALLGGVLDPQLGRENLAVALASATPQGNLACLVTARDAWVDRTQLPIGAFIVWMMHLRDGGRDLLASAYDALARNHAWWWAERDPTGCGLASYGTSDVGEGLYKGTSFGARNESGMDNAPIHDEAAYDLATRTLTTLDVGLNSLLALDAEMLGLIAAALGRTDDAARHRARAEATRLRVQTELWDEARGIFANRLRGGGFVRSLGPTSFYPLVCGAATEAQTARLLEHLDDPATFGGAFVIPGTPRDDPAARDNVYWRGRVWPPLNYMVWQGLRRAGRFDRATRLAQASVAMFRAAWDTRRICAENYNAESGEPLDQPDTDGFYTWGALLPLLGVAEVMDVNPWTGWTLTNGGAPLDLGPLESPAGAVQVGVADGALSLRRAAEKLLLTDIAGRISELCLTDRLISLRLPDTVAAGARLELPSVDRDRVAAVRIGARAGAWRAAATGIALTDLGPGDAGAVVLVAVG